MKNFVFIVTGVGLVVSLAIPTAFAETKKPNGVPCATKDECASDFCSAVSKGVEGPFHQGLCMDRGRNCPIPGGDGIAYEGEYNFGGRHWYCTRGVGLQNDSPARPPDYYYGGSCSGFWEKMDCKGEWLPKVFNFVRGACTASVADPTGFTAAFCTGVELSKKEYEKQVGRQTHDALCASVGNIFKSC